MQSFGGKPQLLTEVCWELATVVHTCDPSKREAEEAGWRV